jgi:hypothetical protein
VLPVECGPVRADPPNTQVGPDRTVRGRDDHGRGSGQPVWVGVNSRAASSSQSAR